MYTHTYIYQCPHTMGKTDKFKWKQVTKVTKTQTKTLEQ